MGVEVARSVAEAAAGADVIITMVTNAEAVRSIASKHGLVEALRPGAVWAQMSTIGVEATKQVAALLPTQRPDALFVDAPVSGTTGTPPILHLRCALLSPRVGPVLLAPLLKVGARGLEPRTVPKRTFESALSLIPHQESGR
jgi:3-hydroxyisobutyrate dehydrogenase